MAAAIGRWRKRPRRTWSNSTVYGLISLYEQFPPKPQPPRPPPIRTTQPAGIAPAGTNAPPPGPAGVPAPPPPAGRARPTANGRCRRPVRTEGTGLEQARDSRTSNGRRSPAWGRRGQGKRDLWRRNQGSILQEILLERRAVRVLPRRRPAGPVPGPRRIRGVNRRQLRHIVKDFDNKVKKWSRRSSPRVRQLARIDPVVYEVPTVVAHITFTDTRPRTNCGTSLPTRRPSG